MAKHFERGAHDSALETRQRHHPNPQPVPVLNTIHGHAVTQAPKVVCRLCNNQWMSELETRGKLPLEPMLLGQPVVLGARDQTDLLRWIVLKLFVFEQRDGAKPAFTREQALRFKVDRSMPDNLAVDLFHTTDDRLRTVLSRESAAIPPALDPAPGRVVTNVQAVTFGIGRLLIYARHAQLGDLGFKQFPPNITCRLHPITDQTINWPPREALSFDDMKVLNGGIGRFLANMTPV